MIQIIPSIALRKGKVVKMRKGDPSSEKAYDENPLDLAKRFEDHGIDVVHLVDLDGAERGSPKNFHVLEAIANHPDMYLGLLTGNVERGARMKLDHFDLNKHFELGAYGSDSANRLDLPAVAVGRAKELFKIQFQPDEVVIIGDAVNDVYCAKGYNAKCIAVNTGKTSWEDLQATGPEYLFKSLSNTQAVMDAILAPMPVSAERI